MFPRMMKSQDVIAQEKAQAAAEAQAKEQERQQFHQTLKAVATGEHLTDDFETVASDAGRTFSQDEVNGFIRDRLAKERTKYNASTVVMAEKLAGYETTLTEREKQLAAAEHRYQAEKELSRRGLDTDESTLNLVISASVDETMQKIENLSYLVHPPQKAKGNDHKDVLRQIMGLNDPK